ncbi:14843_t:CDS:2, partial [Acaulospora colombiana]
SGAIGALRRLCRYSGRRFQIVANLVLLLSLWSQSPDHIMFCDHSSGLDEGIAPNAPWISRTSQKKYFFCAVDSLVYVLEYGLSEAGANLCLKRFGTLGVVQRTVILQPEPPLYLPVRNHERLWLPSIHGNDRQDLR